MKCNLQIVAIALLFISSSPNFLQGVIYPVSPSSVQVGLAAYLQGEYGLEDVVIGVPCPVGMQWN